MVKKKSDRKKGADKDRARIEAAAGRRMGRPKKTWKAPTKSLESRALALLVNHKIEQTLGNGILAKLAVQHIDVVDCLYVQSIINSVEMRQLSTMVSAGKRVESILEKLGIAGEIGPGDLMIPIASSSSPTVRRPTKKKAKKTTKKKPAAKKVKKGSKTPSKADIADFM